MIELTKLPFSTPTISIRDDQVDLRMITSVERAFQSKQAQIDTALKNGWERYNPLVISLDAFDVFEIGFEGAMRLAPSLKTFSSLVLTSTICGVIAGVLNIGGAIAIFKSARDATGLNDNRAALRLYLDAFCTFAIGVIMILISLAKEVIFLSALGFFFAANPYLLPILFFIVTFPTILETLDRLSAIAQGSDWASKLKMNDLRKLLIEPKTEEVSWEAIDDLGLLQKIAPSNTEAEDLDLPMMAKLEELQADIGVEGAVAAFRLLKELHHKNVIGAREAFLEFEAKIQEWRIAQVKRLAEELLCGMAFGFSMGNLSGNISSLTALETGSLMASSGIALQMDLANPFTRSTPVVLVGGKA